ncbi:Rieske [2Fe-2S] domain protein [compost metagenome]
MKRNEFLTKLGIGTALICTGNMLQACGKSGDNNVNPDDDDDDPKPVNFTLDITTELPTVGSSKTKQDVIVVRTASAAVASSFVALEAVCPHEQGSIFYSKDNANLECSLHSSRYKLDGLVINGPVNASGSTRALKLYNVTLSGNIITVTNKV